MTNDQENRELEALQKKRSFGESTAARYLTLISGYDWTPNELARLAEQGKVERARGAERGWWKYKRSSIDAWWESEMLAEDSSLQVE